ncbi:MAG: DNA translocase FtsK [Actinomycetota bacterium]|nr:DNA translocase FtsK [Actinomycetota bacterium]
MGLFILGVVALSLLVSFRIFGVLGDRYNHLLGVLFGPLRFALFVYLAYYGLALALAVRSSLKERYLISGGGAIVSAAVIVAAILNHFNHGAPLSYSRRGGVIAYGLFMGLSKIISPTGAVIVASLSLLTFASDLAGYGPLTVLRKKRHLVAGRFVDPSRGGQLVQGATSEGIVAQRQDYIDLDAMERSYSSSDFEEPQTDATASGSIINFDGNSSIDDRGALGYESKRDRIKDRLRSNRAKKEDTRPLLGGSPPERELYDQFSDDKFVAGEFEGDEQLVEVFGPEDRSPHDFGLSGHLVQELHFEGSIDLRSPEDLHGATSNQDSHEPKGATTGEVTLPKNPLIYDYQDEGVDRSVDREWSVDAPDSFDQPLQDRLESSTFVGNDDRFEVGHDLGEAGTSSIDVVDENSYSPLADDDQSDSPDSDVTEGKVEWRLPSTSILKRSQVRSLDKNELWNRGTVLCKALASHKVETTLVGMTVGPTVTRYELELGAGVKVSRVTSLHKDIAYAMAAADVRILAPIPGRSAIGVEVPNEQRLTVSLGDVLSSPEAAAATHPLSVAIGRDISGKATLVNLAEMPHVLIAGSTGSGKSSCLNSILTSILVRSTPDQVRMILVDPKRVELGQYNGVPHLLTPVVTEPKKAANALNWAVREMESRYNLLSEIGARDLASYNLILDQMEEADSIEIDEVEISAETIAHGDSPLFDSIQEKKYRRLPYIVVVVDELNDLMMVAAKDVEESICRIAQMARAVGIHLVIATQRPSVDVITGLIKANIPSRMAFSVSSLADSRVILDQPGAERLIGKGDMLMLGASSSHPQRLQAPWVSEDEVRKVVATWLRQGKANFIEGLEQGEERQSLIPTDDDGDELFNAAVELVVSSQLGSTTMLQRKLRIGFSRAGRLMDLLERRGIVGPQEGSRPRIVLMTKEEFENEREAGGF